MAAPFLRWAGSKRKLLSVLSEYWSPEYKRYVEPFAGSACLFFHLEPKKALLGDINYELIFAYRQVRSNLPAVLHHLQKWSGGEPEYLKLRGMKPTSLPPSQRAARFIHLNRYCFNGIYRTNVSGVFNVPYGGWRAGYIPPESHFKACSELLENASLRSGSFEKVLEEVRSGDFVYLDPPYSVDSRRVFREYDRSAFGPKQIQRLRAWLRNLDRRGIRFLVSYADSAECRYLAAGYSRRRIRVRRNIAGFTSGRRNANEILIAN